MPMRKILFKQILVTTLLDSVNFFKKNSTLSSMRSSIFFFFFYHIDAIEETREKKLLSSVSTSLALATGLGIAEAVMLSLGSGTLMDIMGIPVVCQP